MTGADKLFYRYCGLDCTVTYECSKVMDGRLMPGQRRHYEFNLRLLAPLLFMELRGIRYDYEKAKQKLKRVERWAAVLQDILNRAAGRTLPAAEDEAAWVSLIRERMCLAKPRVKEEVTTTRTFKTGKTKTTTKVVSKPAAIETLEDCKRFALPSRAREVSLLLHGIAQGYRSPKKRAKLCDLLDLHLKVNSTGSTGDACWFLYERCGFTKQYKKEFGRLTERLASDDEALIKIWVEEQKRPKPWPHGGVRLKSRGRLALVFLKLRRLLTQTRTLRVKPDADGRMRCGYNLFKEDQKGGGPTKTGRLSCSESPTGNGFNLQTVTKPHRGLFLSDEGCLMAQKDLSGADGYTVAAYAAEQGDRTMLEDQQAGLKPAKITALMQMEGPAINQLSREQLKERCKEVDGEGWIYFANKQVVYGSAYGMGGKTMSDGILKKSFKLFGKPIYVAPSMCEQIQKSCFFARYWGIPRWQQWMKAHLMQEGSLIASNGLKRLFFGRKDDHNTLKEALAHLPQTYTTYATMLALLRLWDDPENRQQDGSLLCEPLHTVHDSLIDQFKEELKDWAVAKHAQWFNNPILIAREMIVIPAEGAMGRDWKNLTEGAI